MSKELSKDSHAIQSSRNSSRPDKDLEGATVRLSQKSTELGNAGINRHIETVAVPVEME